MALPKLIANMRNGACKMFKTFKGYTISTKDGANFYHLITIPNNHEIRLNAVFRAKDSNPTANSPVRAVIYIEGSSPTQYFLDQTMRQGGTFNGAIVAKTIHNKVIRNTSGSSITIRLSFINEIDSQVITAQYTLWGL